jgi:hypothetical protein
MSNHLTSTSSVSRIAPRQDMESRAKQPYGPKGGVADSLDEAKAAFRTAPCKTPVACLSLISAVGRSTPA